jgi:hypothetical protein
MLKCDYNVNGRNTASMHRYFRRPEEGFLCCMRAITANRLYYLRSLKYKERTFNKGSLFYSHCGSRCARCGSGVGSSVVAIIFLES